MTKKSSARKPRLPQRSRARPEALPPFRLTPRDQEIVRAVAEYGGLTTNQISDLLFVPADVPLPKPPSSRCIHRLKVLYHHQFLSRHEQPHTLLEGRKPFVYRLDTVGAEWLALADDREMDTTAWRPGQDLSPLFLEHLLASNDVRIAIVRSARKHGFTIEKWLDERTLKQAQNKDTVVLTTATGKRQSAAVVPDGYFHLCTGPHHYHQFVEIDRRTLTGSSRNADAKTWARRIATYIEYYRSGKYHERYHTKSLRVLTVTTGERRLANLKAIAEQCGGRSRFWFTTFERVRAGDVLVDPIWTVAAGDGLRSLTW